jgi:hypothetical protein
VIKYSILSNAKNAAKLISYLTNKSILITRSSDKNNEWTVDSDIEFHVALFILRFDLEKPTNAPFWWEDMTAVFGTDSKRWDWVDISLKAIAVPIERLPGKPPSPVFDRNMYALTTLKKINDRAEGFDYNSQTTDDMFKCRFNEAMISLYLVEIKTVEIIFNLEEDESGEIYRASSIPSAENISWSLDQLANLASWSNKFQYGFNSLVVKFDLNKRHIYYQHFKVVNYSRNCHSTRDANFYGTEENKRQVSVELRELNEIECIRKWKPLGEKWLIGYFSCSRKEDGEFIVCNVGADYYGAPHGGYHYQNDHIGLRQKNDLRLFFNEVISTLAKPEPKEKESIYGNFSINYSNNLVSWNIGYMRTENEGSEIVSFPFSKFTQEYAKPSWHDQFSPPLHEETY